MEDDGYRRKRRFFYGQLGNGVNVPEVAHGLDAPYGRRDARFWWWVVAALVVVIAVVGAGLLLGL